LQTHPPRCFLFIACHQFLSTRLFESSRKTSLSPQPEPQHAIDVAENNIAGRTRTAPISPEYESRPPCNAALILSIRSEPKVGSPSPKSASSLTYHSIPRPGCQFAGTRAHQLAPHIALRCDDRSDIYFVVPKIVERSTSVRTACIINEFALPQPSRQHVSLQHRQARADHNHILTERLNCGGKTVLQFQFVITSPTTNVKHSSRWTSAKSSHPIARFFCDGGAFLLMLDSRSSTARLSNRLYNNAALL